MVIYRLEAMRSKVGWTTALLGQFVFVFAALALSGPGRIDIDDGQARFEVAQSLVDHGDVVIRDPDMWYTILRGRDGQRYSQYRLPHSAAGAVAIWMADATGPSSEARRHFFFTLASAVAAAVLALTYTVLFRFLGLSHLAALGWATLGIFCTPSWYYGTSTFDDIFCSAALVLAVAVAILSRGRYPRAGAAVAGLVLGLAFNCKQPLGAFVLVVLTANYDRQLSWRPQLARIGLVLLGLAVGITGYIAYDLYKFPPGTMAANAALLKQWEPIWTSNPLPGLLSLGLSPGAGCLWYCPTLVLSLVGLAYAWRSDRWFCAAVVAASTIFVLFISMLTFFKGDMSWGPRYLTPIFALLWIFVPAGAARLRPRLVTAVLLAGLGVQLLALSVDPHRLYVQRHLWSRFYVVDPWLYFDPAISHLANRPREIVDILSADQPPAETFTPARSPTYCLPILERIPGGPAAVYQYHVLNALRPWWISQRCLNPEERPVALWPTFSLLAVGLLGGLGLMMAGVVARDPDFYPGPCRGRQTPQRQTIEGGSCPCALFR